MPPTPEPIADFPKINEGAARLVLNARPQNSSFQTNISAYFWDPRNKEPEINLGCGPTHKRIPRGGINQGSDFGSQFTTVAEKLDRVRTLRTGASSTQTFFSVSHSAWYASSLHRLVRESDTYGLSVETCIKIMQCKKNFSWPMNLVTDI